MIGRIAAMVGAAALLATPGSARAADYLGAEAAIRQFSQAAEEANPAGLLRRDLRQFQERAPGMAAEEAARGWLALLDRYLAMDPMVMARRGVQAEPLQFSEIAEALPPPKAWDALIAAIHTRTPPAERRGALDGAMLVFADALQGDAKAQWADLLDLRRLLKRANAQQRQLIASSVAALLESAAQASGDPNRVAQVFEMQLTEGEGAPWEGGSGPQVPELVQLVGPQRAEAILRKALLTARSPLSFEAGGPTEKLARKLALELVAKLPAPQWSLAASLDGAELYEALEKRFPPGVPARKGAVNPQQMAMQDFRVQQMAQARMGARVFYVLSRVERGKMAEAVRMAPVLRQQGGYYGHGGGPVEQLAARGHRKEALEFLRTVLDRWPDLPLWDEYARLALEEGKGAALVQQLQTTAQRKTLTPQTSASLREQLYKALLQLDRVDEAVVVLRALMQKAPGPDEEGGGSGGVEHALVLARLGRALGKDEWVQEGLRVALRAYDAPEGTQAEPDPTELADLLQEVGRGPEAERILISALARTNRPEMEAAMMNMGQEGGPLLALTELYHRAGRHADVLLLLRQAPSWSAKDLSEILSHATPTHDLPLGYMAAAALVNAGRKAEAVRVLRALLLQRSDLDPAYELLANLEGAEALPFLDGLFQRDRFQERPLIWKAYVLHRVGRLDEAEKAARDAIAIDPSDGEMKFGRRMRVYAVLADILASKGDRNQSEMFRGVVRAIRLSEKADTLAELELLPRALTLYNESLTQFADAYCIQSRLAVRLAEQGRLKEAEEHFRRAFELMPVSFGRVETHCLGCEGVFTSKQAQAVAEKVFAQLAARNPERPQIHYLLGYLRESQERYAEALQHYRTAVQRDPDYLNAWKHLLAVGQKAAMPAAERDRAALAILRLDPLSQHQTYENVQVTDLRALWNAAEKNASLTQASKEGLLPLSASAAALERLELLQPQLRLQRRQMQAQRFRFRFRGAYYPGMPAAETADTPGQLVAQSTTLQLLQQIVDTLRMNRQQGVQ